MHGAGRAAPHISDAFVFLICDPNILGLYFLAPIVKAEMDDHMRRRGASPNHRAGPGGGPGNSKERLMEVEGGMLFAGRQTFDSYLDMRRRQIPEIVNDLQDQELTDTSDSVLLRRILQNVEVDLIKLRSKQEQIKRFQSEIDVSREPGRFPRIDERGPCFQPATTNEHVIPFSGPAELFELKIGSSSRKLPRGRVEGDQIIILCRVANDRFDNPSDEFKKGSERKSG